MAGAAALVLNACGGGSGAGSGQRPAAEARPVTLVEGEPATAIVQRADGSQRRLDGPPLAALLAPVEPLAAFKTVADSGDDYGFGHPRYVAAFDSAAGRITLVLGTATFDNEGVYARRCGEGRVHLITRTFFAAIERIAAEGAPQSGPPLGC